MQQWPNRQSIRLRGWDYSRPATYFITINTKCWIRYLSEVKGGKVILSAVGEIVDEEWLATRDKRKDLDIKLGEYVIMPDHFHGIIRVGKKANKHHRPSHFQRPTKDLPSIIRGFKGAATSRAKKIEPGFAWHRGYYEKIIRDDQAYERISRYIRLNPSVWELRDR